MSAGPDSVTISDVDYAPDTRSGRLVIAAVAVALLATAAAVSVSLWASVSDGSRLMVPIGLGVDFVAFSVMGAVVALARPGNKVGWIMLAGGTFSSVGGAMIDVADHGLLHAQGSVPLVSVWAVAGGSFRTVGWYLATVGVPIYFPDGRLAGLRWRWLPRAAVTGVAMGVFGTVFATHAQLNELPDWQNPVSTGVLNAIADPISGVSLVVTVGTAAAAVAQLIVRWRRAGPVGRQQIGMFAAAAALPILATPLGVTGVGGAWVFAVTLLPLPFVVAYAVLARGLYDLATAANRTLVWLTLSGTVVAIYALVLAGVGTLLDAAGAVWLPWLAAAVVAVSFAPLRDVLQRGINRLTFGRWDDPYQVLTTLGQHLEASADTGRLLGEVAVELESTLGLRHVTIADDDGSVLAGADAGAVPEELPLVAYGRSVGTLSYVANGSLRTSDRRLLDGLAVHVASLLHAHSLTRDLQRARERLVLAREEERRRLRRDLHDGLGPALAGHVLRLELVVRELPPEASARRALEALREDVRTTVADVRRVVEGLRPPALDEIGLTGAVTQTVQRLTAGTSVHGEVRVTALPAMTAAVEVAVYRIVSEAVTNTVKHAGATRCVVTIGHADQRVQVRVSDDGRGIPPDHQRGHGLATMRERAEELGGQLRITTAPGTTVTAEIPTGAASVPDDTAASGPVGLRPRAGAVTA